MRTYMHAWIHTDIQTYIHVRAFRYNDMECSWNIPSIIPYVTLHCIALYYITLHYITLHAKTITMHHICPQSDHVDTTSIPRARMHYHICTHTHFHIIDLHIRMCYVLFFSHTPLHYHMCTHARVHYHIRTHTHLHYIHKYAHLYAYAYACVYIYIYICIYAHNNLLCCHVYMFIYTIACTHTHLHY